MKFIVTQEGSCTTYITREIEVEANCAEEARDLVDMKGYGEFKYTEEFEIDDDYSEFNSVTLQD